MEALKQDISDILSQMDPQSSLDDMLAGFCEALKKHADVLGALEGRYRLSTTDTGVNVGFALSADGFCMLNAGDAADATILGKEEDLLKILRRELNPMSAMFTGKLTVKGSMQALMKFAQIL